MAYLVQYEFQERNMYPVASLNSLKNFDRPRVFLLSSCPQTRKKRSKKKRPRIVPLSAQRSKRKTDCSKSDHGIELCVINTLFSGFAKKTWIPAFPCSQFCLPWPSVANLIIGLASENEMLFPQKGNLLVRDNDKALLSSPVFAPILTQGFVDLTTLLCLFFFSQEFNFSVVQVELAAVKTARKGKIILLSKPSRYDLSKIVSWIPSQHFPKLVRILDLNKTKFKH